jgi:uncharacterized iron-regulated membrane protein
MNTTYGTPAGGYGSPPADPSSTRSRKKRLFRWGAGVTLAGFLAGGGIALAAVSGGFWDGTAAASSASYASGASSARAAELNSALSTAASSASTTPPARVRWALGRLRRLGGVDGEFTFHNKTGFHTLAFERGTVQSVSGSNVVIKAADGTTWTWQIVSDTVVRKNGAKTTTSALSAGETVFAGGPVVSGAKDARLIVIRAAGSSGSSGSSGPSGSESAQTTLS